MSFEKLSKKDLVDVAEEFGVDSTGTKADILDALEEEGVTFDLYESLKNAGTTSVSDDEVEVASAPALESDTLVVFKGQGSYSDEYGNWSAKSPFAVVPSSTAEALEARWPGVFRVATADEAADYYG